MNGFTYSPLDFLFTCVSLPLFLLDIGLDVWAAVNFYQDGSYVFLAILVVCLVGSSLLVQAYSWLWYSYEDFETSTKVEKCLSKGSLKLLHVFQLGIYLRHAAVFESSLSRLSQKDKDDWAVYLSHDLSMLRVIETFTESSPQLVLMLTIMLQEGRLDPVTVLKATGSLCAIAYCVTMYHRSLRSFLPEKEKQLFSSSIVYFLWNLLLLVSRFTALSLFASVLPCFILTHFFCSWLVLFFCAWRCQTDFMDSSGGEWLYRATVGLIWYFDWFNVTDGKTRNRTLLYHGYALADISYLCSVWFWQMKTNPPDFVVTPFYAMITACCVVAVYILGIFLKMIYYKCYHPNISKEDLKGDHTEIGELNLVAVPDEVDSPVSKRVEKPDGGRSDIGIMCLANISVDGREDGGKEGTVEVQSRSLPTPTVRYNKRMRKLAENFYS